VLVATHDARRGMAIADRVVHVDAGRVLDGVGVR
jgi:energy-coupling factor transporter ATP-binding protein EcfA2